LLGNSNERGADGLTDGLGARGGKKSEEKEAKAKERDVETNGCREDG